MVLIWLLPVLLSIFLLAAHVFRAGFFLLVFVVLASLFILLVRRPWAARVIQAELVLGGIEWIRTAVNLVDVRQMHGMPWVRLAVILGAVALFTLCSAVVFRLKPLRERYYQDKRSIT